MASDENHFIKDKAYKLDFIVFSDIKRIGKEKTIIHS